MKVLLAYAEQMEKMLKVGMEKKDCYPCLEKLDDRLSHFLESFDFEFQESQSRILNPDINQELAFMEADKKADTTTHAIISLDFIFRQLNQRIQDDLTMFVSDIRFTALNEIQFTISTSLFGNSSFESLDPFSEEKKMKEKVRSLKEQGLMVIPGRCWMYEIPFCDQNIRFMNQYVSGIGGEILSFSSSDKELDEMKCSMSITDYLKAFYNWTTPNQEKRESDLLTEDDCVFLSRELKDFYQMCQMFFMKPADGNDLNDIQQLVLKNLILLVSKLSERVGFVGRCKELTDEKYSKSRAAFSCIRSEYESLSKEFVGRHGFNISMLVKQCEKSVNQLLTPINMTASMTIFEHHCVQLEMTYQNFRSIHDFGLPLSCTYSKAYRHPVIFANRENWAMLSRYFSCIFPEFEITNADVVPLPDDSVFDPNHMIIRKITGRTRVASNFNRLEEKVLNLQNNPDFLKRFVIHPIAPKVGIKVEDGRVEQISSNVPLDIEVFDLDTQDVGENGVLESDRIEQEFNDFVKDCSIVW